MLKLNEFSTFGIVNWSADGVTINLSISSAGDTYLAPNGQGAYGLTQDQFNTRQQITITNSIGTIVVNLGAIISDNYSFLAIVDNANGSIQGYKDAVFGTPYQVTSTGSGQENYSFLCVSFTPTYFAKFLASLNNGSGYGQFSQLGTYTYLIKATIAPDNIPTYTPPDLQDQKDQQQQMLKNAGKIMLIIVGVILLLVVGAVIIFIGLIYYKKHNAKHS